MKNIYFIDNAYFILKNKLTAMSFLERVNQANLIIFLNIMYKVKLSLYYSNNLS